VRWRCLDLREQITQRFSVTFHERSVGKLLHRLNLTRLQPRPYHPKKDAASRAVGITHHFRGLPDTFGADRGTTLWRTAPRQNMFSINSDLALFR